MRDLVVHQRIRVAFDLPLVFTHGVLGAGNEALARAFRLSAAARRTLCRTLQSPTQAGAERAGAYQRQRAMFFIDSAVTRAMPDLPKKIRAWAKHNTRHVLLAAPPRIVPGGERIKHDRRRLAAITDDLIKHRMCRHSFVVIIGGGAVLDAVGFVAATVHRGLRVVRLPTTTLAQCDSGVGVKTAINLPQGKNLVGVFAPPHAVINDADFLLTLPDDVWRDGIAEAFKVAIIKDRAFFDFLSRNIRAWKRRDEARMRELVRRCALLHADHIRRGGDPFELGRARPLDFGHWSAHKLEVLTHHRVRHGEAVAVGVALDSIFAARRGWLSERDLVRILNGLRASGLPIWHPALKRRDAHGRLAILGGLEDFREHLGGELTLTFPRAIGRMQQVSDIRRTEVIAAIRDLERRVQSPC